jgi:hypothetical protein
MGEVEVDGVRPGECEEYEGNAHGVSGTDLVCNVAENDWNDRTTADGGDKERRTTLGVTTKSAKCEGKDDRENARLEELEVEVSA